MDDELNDLSIIIGLIILFCIVAMGAILYTEL
jgi:hypothetical protein